MWDRRLVKHSEFRTPLGINIRREDECSFNLNAGALDTFSYKELAIDGGEILTFGLVALSLEQIPKDFGTFLSIYVRHYWLLPLTSLDDCQIIINLFAEHVSFIPLIIFT